MADLRLERVDLDEWADRLPATGYELFHLPAALSALEPHVDGELHLRVAYRGQQPVAMVPLFVRETPVGRAVLSPPPSRLVPRLGPLLMPSSPKRRKREKLNRRFAEAVLDAYGADAPTTLFRMECPVGLGDPRPYGWAGLSVEPAFTYRVDVEGRSADDVLGSFSRSLRRDVRSARDLDVTVRVEGVEGARAVYRDTADRFAEQDEPFVDEAYALDVVRGMPDRRRVYVVRGPNGQYLGGVIVLYADDVAYYWLGGAGSTYENVSVTSLVHYRILADIAEDPDLDGVSRYDLVGANTPRLCEYKAKFGGELVPYYVVESTGVPMRAAKAAYGAMNRLLR